MNRQPPVPRSASRVRVFCCLGAIASVMVAAAGTPAGAQDAARDQAGTPAPAQGGAPERVGTPAPAPDATRDQVGTPAPAQGGAPDRVGTPAPASDATRDQGGTPAPAQSGAPDRVGTPAPASDATRDQGGTPAPAQSGAPDRVGTPAPAPGRKGTTARAQPKEPDHVRGQIAKVEGSSIEVQTRDGKTLRLGLSDALTIISLAKGSFTAIDFGVYVGAVAVRLEEYSPIVRDSLSWLHRGFELRIIDEQLRGIALGHKKWDLTPETIIAHGWVDDIEGRVISIKWGPTEEEETDVETPRDAPVLKMSLGDKSLLKAGAHVFAGAQQDGNGKYVAVFIFIGKDGIVPPL